MTFLRGGLFIVLLVLIQKNKLHIFIC